MIFYMYSFPSILWQSLVSKHLLFSLLTRPLLLLRVLQDLGLDHLPIRLTVPLSSVFHSNEHPPSFNFQKARWEDFDLCFDSQCPFTEEYSSLSFSSAAALFTSLALNAAKVFISFGRVKRQSQTWWFAEVEEAVSKK